MSVTFKFDTAGILDSIEQANCEAIAETAFEIREDSNYYCKQDQNMLIASSQNSDLKRGVIVWDTPYAQRQYYLESAHKDKNPNAQMMWFHKAKDVYGEQWFTVYKNAFNKARR